MADLTVVKETDKEKFERLYHEYKRADKKCKEFEDIKESYRKEILELMRKLGYKDLVVPNLFSVSNTYRTKFDKDVLRMELAKNGVAPEVVNKAMEVATIKSDEPTKSIRAVKKK